MNDTDLVGADKCKIVRADGEPNCKLVKAIRVLCCLAIDNAREHTNNDREDECHKAVLWLMNTPMTLCKCLYYPVRSPTKCWQCNKGDNNLAGHGEGDISLLPAVWRGAQNVTVRGGHFNVHAEGHTVEKLQESRT